MGAKFKCGNPEKGTLFPDSCDAGEKGKISVNDIYEEYHLDRFTTGQAIRAVRHVRRRAVRRLLAAPAAHETKRKRTDEVSGRGADRRGGVQGGRRRRGWRESLSLVF